jgi:hypothetical protein
MHKRKIELTTSLGQICGQPLVLLFHRQISLADFEQALNNRFYPNEEMKIKSNFLRASPSVSTSTHPQGLLGEKQIRTTQIFKKNLRVDWI